MLLIAAAAVTWAWLQQPTGNWSGPLTEDAEFSPLLAVAAVIGCCPLGIGCLIIARVLARKRKAN
ncbi:MAG TPA: hypothetical protein VHE55_10345 [Fimbriimonadaceae bacterium]|nr:hypothetical protein [Fimbriimonadaceae bacterium]